MSDEPSASLAAAIPPTETVRYGTHPAQVYDVRLPPMHAPARSSVVLLHGGFWRARYDRSHVAAMAQHMADSGHATAVLEYRRPGMDGAGYRETLADVGDGLVAVAGDARVPHPLVAVGHSAGGQLAVWLASQPGAAGRVSAVVSLAGCVDLELAVQMNLGEGAVEAFLGGKPAEAPEAYAIADPARLVPCPVPITLVHGEADTEVPIRMSESYLKKARQAGSAATLVRLPGVGHYELIDPTEAALSAVLTAIEPPEALEGRGIATPCGVPVRATGDPLSRDTARFVRGL